MPHLLPTATATHPVRRRLQLRHLVRVQRQAIRRALDHGESRGTLARLNDRLRALEIELADVERLAAHQRGRQVH